MKETTQAAEAVSPPCLIEGGDGHWRTDDTPVISSRRRGEHMSFRADATTVISSRRREIL